MKKHTISILFIILIALCSCSSEVTKEGASTDSAETGNSTIKTEVAGTEASQRTDESPVAVSDVESVIEEGKNKEEIALIYGEVMRINGNLASYTKKESTANWETLTCKLTQYVNENGAIVKIESVCGNHDWAMYCFELSKTESKLLYGKYLEKVPNAARPEAREFYSIGTMIPSENAYTMIVDASDKEVEPAGYRKYTVLYEAAFDAFFNE
jgi:hypothetical protein